jgi:hypothetical protein
MSLANTPKATKSLKYGILIVCEDTKSNYFYLEKKVEEIKKANVTIPKPDFVLKNSGDVEGTQTDKFSLYVIAKVDRLNREYENSDKEIQDFGEEDKKKLEPEKNFFREVYIIADVDDNEYQNGKYLGKVTNAINELATAHTTNPIITYKLLLSNECFEIWYILHFQDITEQLYRGTKPQIDAGLIKQDKSNLLRKQLGLSAGISVNAELQKQRTDFFEIMQEKGNEIEAIKRAKNLAKTKQPTEKFARNPSTDIYILIEMLNNLK